MNTFIADFAPAIPALILAALFIWALERSNRRHPTAPWAGEWRHHVDHDADHRRSEHDWDAYHRAA